MLEKANKMNDEETLPKRKHPRLKKYDYSMPGAYFITICTNNKKCILSTVGRASAPAESIKAVSNHMPATVDLTEYGKIAEEELCNVQKRFANANVSHYVIMPNHIHLILELVGKTAGASPRPTVMEIICALKSLITMRCRKIGFNDKLFQVSFHDHVIRNEIDYNETVKYIYENPSKWYYDELHSE